MIEIESLISLAVIGFAAGFFFSVPVAGPVSIIITSHALKGDRHFAFFTAFGAAIIDIIYCFIAVFGFTQLYEWYRPYIPITLVLGAVFLFFIGLRIRKTSLDLDHFGEQNKLKVPAKRFQRRGKFMTGFMINLLNPSLFIGWLTSSFLILSLAASLGLNVGGLNYMIGNNVESVNGHNESHLLQPLDSIKTQAADVARHKTELKTARKYQLLNSLSYAVAVGVGSVVWFYIFSGFLVRHRKKLQIGLINKIIHGMGFVLWIFGAYLFYEALNIFLG